MTDFTKVIYIEGDGVGAEITPVMRAVLDAAMDKAYGGSKAIAWEEAYAGAKAEMLFGTNLPESTLKRIKEVGLAIKGPLMTPVGKGARSINVALRQSLDLYVCLRPVKYFESVPSPVRHPEKVDMVVFRENTEDIYAGIEWPQGSDEVKRVISFLQNEMHVSKIRFPESSAIGIKPVSVQGSERLIRAAIDYAIANNRRSVTLVHKGNIMKYTEGGFRLWGYELAKRQYGAYVRDGRTYIPRPSQSDQLCLADLGDIEIKDCICDAFLQNILLKPEDYDVIATLNLNGDYVSDALAAQVGGIGISPGANINYQTGCAIFEATHGIAPDIVGQDIVNPLSLVLSGEMLLRHAGFSAAADLVLNSVTRSITAGRVTRDFQSLMVKEGRLATCVGTKEFGKILIQNL